MAQAADHVDTQAQKLAAGEEENIFAKAAASGDSSKVCEEIRKLADDYNHLLEVLQKSSGELNRFYAKSLKDLAAGNQEALESVGVSVGKDGRLSVDSDRLAAAGIEELEKVFGGKGSFVSGTSFLSSRIADNARAEAESLSNLYGSNGRQNAGTGAGYGKYDLWG